MSRSPVSPAGRERPRRQEGSSCGALVVVGAVILAMALGITAQFVHGPVRLVLALLYFALTVPAAGLAVILRSRGRSQP